MRRRLVAYFARKRCAAPDELADETFNRVTRRLQEQGDIPDPPARYCYVVAKFVFLEYLRRPERTTVSAVDHLVGALPVLQPSSSRNPHETETIEARLERLDECLRRLAPRDKDLILDYYRADERGMIDHRRDLAARLGVTANALMIRACRIRTRLEGCVKARSEGR